MIGRPCSACFAELADAKPWTVIRRTCDARDLLDGLAVPTVSAMKRDRFAVVSALTPAQESRT